MAVVSLPKRRWSPGTWGEPNNDDLEMTTETKLAHPIEAIRSGLVHSRTIFDGDYLNSSLKNKYLTHSTTLSNANFQIFKIGVGMQAAAPWAGDRTSFSNCAHALWLNQRQLPNSNLLLILCRPRKDREKGLLGVLLLERKKYKANQPGWSTSPRAMPELEHPPPRLAATCSPAFICRCFLFRSPLFFSLFIICRFICRCTVSSAVMYVHVVSQFR